MRRTGADGRAVGRGRDVRDVRNSRSVSGFARPDSDRRWPADRISLRASVAGGSLISMSETQPPSPTTTHVRLIGGPDDWHRVTLTHLSSAELAAPRETLGSYLVSTCVPPGHPDPGARAVYEPDVHPALANIWFFRGWVPAGPADAESRTTDHHQAVDVTLDTDYIPTGWVTDDGGRHRVDRILAHWQASGEDDLAPDVWHVCSGDQDWVLLAHPGHWEAGQLLAEEDQDHDDILG